MRTFSKKKKLPRLLTLCGAVAVSAWLGGFGLSCVLAVSSIWWIIIPEVSVRIREIRGRIFLLHYVRIIPRIVT